jgi:hypothetical protein
MFLAYNQRVRTLDINASIEDGLIFITRGIGHWNMVKSQAGHSAMYKA